MSTAITPIPVSSSATAISVPDSAGFIGGADDAVILEMIVLMSTSDRFRDTIRAGLAGAERIINALEALSDRLNQFGKLIRNNWTPVTYASLVSSDKSAAALQSLFAADGPNLGHTLADSQSVLASLNSDGIALDAPKQTPVLVESFLAVKDKVDLNSTPVSTTLSWKSDTEVQAINSGTLPGSYPGSVVKTVEVRDSGNKLVSVTRTTLFVDYANLRPTQQDLSTAFNSLQHKILPLMADMEDLIQQAASKKNLLDERMSKEMSKVVDDQAFVASLKQKQSDDLQVAAKLLRRYRIELENWILRTEKSNSKSKNTEEEIKNDQQSSTESEKALRPPAFLLMNYESMD